MRPKSNVHTWSVVNLLTPRHSKKRPKYSNSYKLNLYYTVMNNESKNIPV